MSIVTATLLPKNCHGNPRVDVQGNEQGRAFAALRAPG